MTDQFTYKQLPADPCLTQEQMLNYIDGKLSFEEQHVCEKHMADCDLCADALEGLELVKNRAALLTPVSNRQENIVESGKVIALQPERNNKMWYAAAAVLLLILGSVFLFKQITNQDSTSVTAANESKADSIGQPNVSTEWTVASDSENAAVVTGGVDQDRAVLSSPDTKAPVAQPGETYNLQAEEKALGAAYEVEDVAPSEAPVALQQTDQLASKDIDASTVVVEEADKKTTFWERAKAAVPVPNTNSKPNQQSIAKEDSRSTSEQSSDTDFDDAPGANSGAPPSVSASDEGKSETYGQVLSDSAVVNSNGPHPLKPSDNDLELSYTNGMNLMNSGQYNSAIVFFDEVLKVKTHARYEDAEFQKANALIKSNRKAEAKILLQSIEAKKGKHAAEATQLLKTL